jgi:hypothetical protein
MRTVNDCLAHCTWLIEKGRGEEAAKLFLPRLEAQRRRANKEHKRRIIFEADEQGYAEWHIMRERLYQLIPNKTIALHVMVDLLQKVPDEMYKQLAEEEIPF